MVWHGLNGRQERNGLQMWNGVDRGYDLPISVLLTSFLIGGGGDTGVFDESYWEDK